MSRILLTSLLCLGLTLGQPPPPAAEEPEADTAPETVAPAPRFPTQETGPAQPAPMFRPKVVTHTYQEIVLPKDPFLAGALSIPLPGTGQAYCGRWGRAFAFLAGSLGSILLGAAVGDEKSQLAEPYRSTFSTVLIVGGLGVWGWSVVDGVRIAKDHNRRFLDLE